MGERTALVERLTAKVSRAGPDDCWLFTGALNSDGYGVIRDESSRLVLAHRVTLALAGGDVAGKIVRHSCDNPPCCNPAHLMAGTSLENNRDTYEHGRGRLGSQRVNAKLTEDTVRAARRRIADGDKQGDVAAELGVSESTISNAVSGRTWAHVA